MRMFALKDLLTTLCSVLFALAAMANSVSADNKTSSEPKAASSKSASTKTAKIEDSKKEVDERDYYTRRAQELLDADQAADAKPHPLAENYPEHYVVVCTGGCKNHQAHIVDFEPRKSLNETEVGEMIPTAAGGAAEPGVNVVRCVGGCPKGNSIYFAASDVGADWDGTSSAAKSGTKTESGRWMSDQN